MPKLSKYREQMLYRNCLAVLVEFFADMINPENRGQNFKWANFSTTASKFCTAQLGLHMKTTEYEKELARRFCAEMATHLVSLAGLDRSSKK